MMLPEMGAATPPESESRQRIIAVARRLFLEQGYRGQSMRQIAETCGVSKALLYYYFRDKEQLFVAVLLDSLNEIEGLLDACEAHGGRAQERIRFFVQGLLSLPSEQRGLMRLASQEIGEIGQEARQLFDRQYQERFIDRLATIMREGIGAGELRPLDPNALTWGLLGILYPYIYPRSRRARSHGEIEELLALYFNGASAAGAHR
jgi:TetR/AcrR family transcriptional repressor of mexJK operon